MTLLNLVGTRCKQQAELFRITGQTSFSSRMYVFLRTFMVLAKKALTLKEHWQKSDWHSGISSSGYRSDIFDMINDVVEDIELQDSYKR